MDRIMSPARSIVTVEPLIALGAWLLFLTIPIADSGEARSVSPMEVTTDTPEYCTHLFDRVSELVRLATVPVPHEVNDLTGEGQRMCDHGQTRGGIMRLRSALMLMEKSNGAAYR